jgi:hypothetical protein
VVTGNNEDIAKFKEAAIDQDESGDDQFSCNKLIPMPKELSGTQSPIPRVAELLSCKKKELLQVASDLDLANAGFPDVTREQMLQAYKKEHGVFAAEEIETAKKGLRAFKVTGHYDWYSWCCANWGTKWGTYNFRWEGAQNDMRMEFLCESAWAPPEPVFERLGELFPDLSIHITSFDEGWNFACRGTYGHGSKEDPYGPVTANPATYEEVYGYPPQMEGSDEEENAEAEDASADEAPEPVAITNDDTLKLPTAPQVFSPEEVENGDHNND